MQPHHYLLREPFRSAGRHSPLRDWLFASKAFIGNERVHSSSIHISPRLQMAETLQISIKDQDGDSVEFKVKPTTKVIKARRRFSTRRSAT